MELILLSGGSGKRLWPLSNDIRSKQFLKVIGSGEAKQSMLQRVWGQIQANGMHQSAHFAVGRPQVDILQSQLGYEINIIVEPERRDTFPAIALAAVYLYSIRGIGLKETVGVMPVDSYAEDGFFRKILSLEQVLRHSGADLALMGVTPDHPSEKFGYTVPVQDDCTALGDGTEYYGVERFVEKPDEEAARELIRQQAFWNCGVFAFRLEYIINELIARGLPIQYDELLHQYSRVEKISFDYAVVEKAERIVVVPYQGKWKDLGTWNTLTEEIHTPLIGKGIIAEGSANTHVINELDIPVTVIGASNLVIAASPDGILVSDKEASPKVKEVMKLQDQRPMYEERRWGRYRVLDYTRYPEGREVLTKRICLLEGKNLSYQYHQKRSEVWTVISGEGELILNGELKRLRAGDVALIPVHARHSLRAITEIEIIEVQTGSELVEEDIVRLTLDWTEMLRDFVSTK